jgi:hypothetical protein
MGINISVKTKFTINGQTYGSVDDMPADVRRMYDQAIGTIDRDGNGVPDLLPPRTRIQNTAAPQRIEARDRSIAFPTNPQYFGPPSGGPGTFWKIAAVAAAGAVAAGVLYLVFRP